MFGHVEVNETWQMDSRVGTISYNTQVIHLRAYVSQHICSQSRLSIMTVLATLVGCHNNNLPCQVLLLFKALFKLCLSSL